MIQHENRRPTGKLNYTCWYFKMITLKEAASKGIFMLGNTQVNILPFKNIRNCTVYYLSQDVILLQNYRSFYSLFLRWILFGRIFIM